MALQCAKAGAGAPPMTAVKSTDSSATGGGCWIWRWLYTLGVGNAARPQDAGWHEWNMFRNAMMMASWEGKLHIQDPRYLEKKTESCGCRWHKYFIIFFLGGGRGGGYYQYLSICWSPLCRLKCCNIALKDSPICFRLRAYPTNHLAILGLLQAGELLLLLCYYFPAATVLVFLLHLRRFRSRLYIWVFP